MSQAKSADTTSPAAAVPTGGGSSRRALLTAAPAAAGALLAGTAVNAVAIGMAKAGEVDPIFAAIAEHRAAIDAYYDACHNPAAEDETSELCDLEAEALGDLLDCRPTTFAGIAALLDHLAQPQWGEVARDPEHRETVLSGASNWGGDIKVAALKLPGVLAETMRGLIEGGAQS
jgi:hypothetical protein